MGKRTRNEHGHFADGIDPEVTLEAFADRDDDAEPLTTAEVADAVGIAQRTALNKLNRLVDRGELATKKVGARARVWWIPADVQGAREADATDSSTEPPDRPGDAVETRDGAHSGDVNPAAIDGVLEAWRPGRSADEREERRTVGRAVLAWLRDQEEPASATEFKEALYDEHGIEGQSPDTWWKKVARPALQEAEAAGLVTYEHGRHEYRWVGDTPH